MFAFRTSTTPRPKRTILRLDSLEGRDVPAPIVTSFNGGLSKDEKVHTFPAGGQIKEIPAGSTITIKFGGSPDPSGQYKASVALKNDKGATVRGLSLGMTTTRTIFTYPVTQKTGIPWKVTVKSVGKDPGSSIYPYSGSAEIRLPDITMLSAMYIGGDEAGKRSPTGVKAEVGTPKNFKDTFKVGLFRSKDGIEPTGSALVEQTVTADGSGGKKSVTLDTKQPLKATKSEPFLVICADFDKKIDEDNEGNNTRKLSVPNVQLKLPQAASMLDPAITLMKSADFTVETGTQSASGFRIEVRKDGQGNKEYVKTGEGGSSPVKVIPRLAKDVEYMASVVVEGKRFFGEAVDAQVSFPDVQDIVDDTNVKANMTRLWNSTIALIRANGGQDWREYGAFVLLDTKTGKYSFSADIVGNIPNSILANGAPTQAGISGAQFVAPQDVDRADQTGLYVVADFHTHPADMWKARNTLSFEKQRPVGPSGYNGATGNDAQRALNSPLPGIVYDYIGKAGPKTQLVPKPGFPGFEIVVVIPGNYIDAGWDPGNPGKPYTHGATRRLF